MELEIRKIKVDDLVADQYQRGINKSHTKDIAKRFDPRLTGLPIVSIRDGVWYVIDGQHRVAAAKELGITEI